MSSVNITGFDRELFVAVNSTLHIGIFFLLCLPNIILCVLCVAALVLAKGINWKIKTAIINIFAAEFALSISSIFIYLGYPIRASYNDGDISCYIDGFFLLTGTLSNVTAITFYSISTYVFIRYGAKKLSWYVIVTFIAVSWIASVVIMLVLIILASVVYNSNGLQRNTDGFCAFSFTGTNQALNTISELFAAAVIIELITCLILIATFSFLTFRYVKKNTIQENSAIKKAIVKNLLYLSLKVFIVMTCHGVLFGFNALRPIFEENTAVYLYIALQYVIYFCLFEILSLATPVVSLITLRPLRVAIKQRVAKYKICQHNSQHDETQKSSIQTSSANVI